MRILYETKNLIVFIKPAGVLSEEEGNKRSVPLILKEYLFEKGVKDPKIFTVHRLDRDVGGVMVVAKNARTASLLATAVAEHQTLRSFDVKNGNLVFVLKLYMVFCTSLSESQTIL